MKYAVTIGGYSRMLWVVSQYGRHHDRGIVEWQMDKGKRVCIFCCHGAANDPKAFDDFMRGSYMRGYVAYGGGKCSTP